MRGQWQDLSVWRLLPHAHGAGSGAALQDPGRLLRVVLPEWRLLPGDLLDRAHGHLCQQRLSVHLLHSTPPPPPPGGCPYQGICVEDYHCVFPGGITGTCVNGSCVCW